MPSIGIVEKKRKKLTSDERLVFLLIASRMVVCPFSASAITSAPTRDSHIPISQVKKRWGVIHANSFCIFWQKSPILLHLLGILVTSAPTRNSHIPIFQGQKAIGGPILPYLHEQLKQKSMNIIFLVCTLLNCFAL